MRAGTGWEKPEKLSSRAHCSEAPQSAAKNRPPLCRLESCMLMSRVALQLAPAVQAATTRSGVAAPFQVISCTWVARHSDAQRGGLRRESHAKHGPVPTKNQCTKHPSAQSACTQRQKEASTTNTRLLSRHTRGEVNPERGRRADGTDTRLLGRHTRGTNPRAEGERTHDDVRETRNQAARGNATMRGGGARVHFPRLPLMSR